MAILLAAVGYSQPDAGHAAQAGQPEGQTEDEFVVAPESIGAFRYGDHDHRIWESLRNSKTESARLWQFRYDPLFFPEVRADGSLKFTTARLQRGMRVQLKIFLDSNGARDTAFNALGKSYPDKAGELQPSNVTALKISQLNLSIPDLHDQIPSATVASSHLAFFTPTNYFVLQIDAPDQDTADRLISVLPNLRIDYAVGFAAKTARMNSVQVSMKDLRKSSLFAKLNGLGSNEVYVHRDDLRTLSEGISTVIQVSGVLEAPERIDESLFTDILNRLTKPVSTKSFDENKWRSTFNADDLRPDVITKRLNKDFKKDTGKDQWKYSGSLEASAKGGFLGMGAEASTKGSFSTEGLKEWLHQHDVDAEVEGSQIVVKSIQLQQINLAQFGADSQFRRVIAYVAGDSKVQAGSLLLGIGEADGATERDLPTRIAELEKDQGRYVPIGTVIDWYRPTPTTRVPDGYMIADGKVVKDRLSLMDGKPTPDLRDAFVMGVSPDRVGEIGGKNKRSLAHQHRISLSSGGSSDKCCWWVQANGGSGASPLSQAGHTHEVKGQTESALTDPVDMRPSYVGLIKLIRIR